MKKIIFLLIAIATITTSCEQQQYDKNLLQGMWVVDKVDSFPAETDNSHVLQFNADGTLSYHKLVKAEAITDNDVFTNTLNNYLLDKNVLKITRAGTEIEIEIIDLSESILTYKHISHVENGKNIDDPYTYTLRKVTNNIYYPTIIGKWQGKETSAHPVSADEKQWEYLEKESGENFLRYNYFTRNSSTQEWEAKLDNNGKCYIFGDMLYLMWTNDEETGRRTIKGEAWQMTIVGTEMNWTGLRDGGKVRTFKMIKL